MVDDEGDATDRGGSARCRMELDYRSEWGRLALLRSRLLPQATHITTDVKHQQQVNYRGDERLAGAQLSMMSPKVCGGRCTGSDQAMETDRCRSSSSASGEYVRAFSPSGLGRISKLVLMSSGTNHHVFYVQWSEEILGKGQEGTSCAI